MDDFTLRPVKDSGERQEFATGARRDRQAGKGRFDLLPPDGLLAVALHFEAGAEKYGDENWTKGIPLGRYLDSAMRHLCAFRAGDRTEDHLAAATWNCLCGLSTYLRVRAGLLPAELDDVTERGKGIPWPGKQ